MGFQGDVDVAAAAALIGEPARAALLVALTEAESLPARELAARAGIAPSTASGHLARLLDGRLVVAERSGRHRYFRLAGAEVAAAIEALSVIAPPRPVRSLRAAAVGEALREARTCYDHLAGRRVFARPCLDWSERRRHLAGALGAALASTLLERRWVERRDGNRSLEVTP